MRWPNLIAAALVTIAASNLCGNAAALAFSIPIAPSQAQVWVAGKEIRFAHLAIAYGDPVAPIDDPGVAEMLASVAATIAWQPGTRFVAITRADGKLVTFTLGSNAVSVDGEPASMPFAPFSVGSRLYLPLLPLARALDLGIRGFRHGYVFVPQIVGIIARVESRRTVIEIFGSAPLAWRSSFVARERARTLTLSFPGFGTDLAGNRPIGGADAAVASVTQTGPPGYPTTSIAISVNRGVKFTARRLGSGVTTDVVLARTVGALGREPAAPTPRTVRVVVTAQPTPTPTPTQPATAPPQSSASPAPEPTEVPTAEPLGPEATPSTSPAPSASPLEQKITDVSLAETATGTRVTLTLSGPVSFEWHRLADPDNRYWLDIDHATLVGPAQTLESRLPFIKEIKVSQHLIVPDKVVRLSITPAQAIDVRIGSIEGSPNQLGIEIESQPPSPDAPIAGVGSIGLPVSIATSPPSTEPVPKDPNLIVIDPGHGGNDPGSINQAYGLTESKLTLAIALRLANDLKRLGWHVTLTRDGDYEVGDPTGPDKQELQARCDVANAAGARLFVSIHINSSVSSAPNGTTTYYWRQRDRAFAESVQDETVAANGIADDGVKRATFYVIHHTVMPAILVEAAYLSNPHDAEFLREASFLDKIAAGIARGIGDFTGGPQSPVSQNRPSPNSSL